MEEIGALCVVLAEEKYYLQLTRTGEVCGFESVISAARDHEAKYNTNHRRGYEASMSTCIHAIFFQYSYIPFHSLDEIVDAVADTCRVSVSNNAGFFEGVLLKDDIGKAWWESGVQPRLVSDDGKWPKE